MAACDRPRNFGEAVGWALVILSFSVIIGTTWFSALRYAKSHAQAPTETTRPVAAACKAPERDGDRIIITVAQNGGTLRISCFELSDWRSPERKP